VLARHADALHTLTALGLDTEDDEELAAAKAHWPFLCGARQWRDQTLPAVYKSW